MEPEIIKIEERESTHRTLSSPTTANAAMQVAKSRAAQSKMLIAATLATAMLT